MREFGTQAGREKTGKKESHTTETVNTFFPHIFALFGKCADMSCSQGQAAHMDQIAWMRLMHASWAV